MQMLKKKRRWRILQKLTEITNSVHRVIYTVHNNDWKSLAWEAFPARGESFFEGSVWEAINELKNQLFTLFQSETNIKIAIYFRVLKES